MISDWLRAEAFDRTEPVSFYVPGVSDWDTPSMAGCRAMRIKRLRDELEIIVAEVLEEGL